MSDMNSCDHKSDIARALPRLPHSSSPPLPGRFSIITILSLLLLLPFSLGVEGWKLTPQALAAAVRTLNKCELSVNLLLRARLP